MANQEDNPPTVGGGKGSSLEIFLFTNGQQESPPRKYNVRVTDRWDTTLNFLASSQNGLNHTIELYSTEGKKIERGQELTNGAAYVAVEPPHAFLPAGYNDYLMKASRSREKRQEKLSENEPSIKQDKRNSEEKMNDECKDATNIRIIQDITIRSTSRTAIQEQDDIANQVKSDIAKAVKPIRRMSIQQTQKRNNSLPSRSPHVLRKNTNNVTPSTKRGYNPPKIDASKKKVEISSIQNIKNSVPSTKTGTNITKTNEIKSKGDEVGVIGIVSTLNSETVETYSLEKNPDIAKMPGVTGYETTQNLTTDPTIIERNILLPVSPEKEPLESAYIIPIKKRSITNSSSNGKDTLFVPSQSTKNAPDTLNSSPLVASPQADFPKRTSTAENQAANLTNVPNKHFQKKTLPFGSQTNENNFAIYVRQGNMVHLKLNIEVNNVSKTTLDANHNQMSSSSSNTPMKKFDSEILTNNIAGGKNYGEVPTLTEPWRTKYEQLQQITNDLKVGVCNRCSCFRNPESLAPVYIDNNNYFILLPPEEVNEPLVSCTCKLDINEQSNSELLDNKVVKLSRIENNVVKLDEGKTLPTHTCKMNENFEIIKSSAIHDPIIENQLLLKNASITEREMTQCECGMTSAQYQSPVLCDCDESLGLECACDYEQATCPDVVKLDVPANKSLMLKDAFTQTDWSGMVLEARPHEDGSYALHIPPLITLKNTKYLY